MKPLVLNDPCKARILQSSEIRGLPKKGNRLVNANGETFASDGGEIYSTFLLVELFFPKEKVFELSGARGTLAYLELRDALKGDRSKREPIFRFSQG